ncbi:MAG: peroxiredoxin [bacterium]
MLSAGDSVTDFGKLTVVDSKSEREISIEDFKGKTTVLYFYPKDQTPGCIKEACSFRDTNSDIQSMGVQVLGVSGDDISSHIEFIKKYSLNFPLIADTERKLSMQVGSWGKKNLYGKIVVGMMRSTFIVGPDLKIVKVWPKVRAEEHGEAVLEFLKENK